LLFIEHPAFRTDSIAQVRRGFLQPHQVDEEQRLGLFFDRLGDPQPFGLAGLRAGDGEIDVGARAGIAAGPRAEEDHPFDCRKSRQHVEDAKLRRLVLHPTALPLNAAHEPTGPPRLSLPEAGRPFKDRRAGAGSLLLPPHLPFRAGIPGVIGRKFGDNPENLRPLSADR
jgi:hypothetical protein